MIYRALLIGAGIAAVAGAPIKPVEVVAKQDAPAPEQKAKEIERRRKLMAAKAAIQHMDKKQLTTLAAIQRRLKEKGHRRLQEAESLKAIVESKAPAPSKEAKDAELARRRKLAFIDAFNKNKAEVEAKVAKAATTKEAVPSKEAKKAELARRRKLALFGAWEKNKAG